MKQKAIFAAAGALLMLGAQPCLAADDMRGFGNIERRSGVFAGASVKMPLGSRKAARPSARLQLGMRHVQQDSAGRLPVRAQQIGLLELGGAVGGKPALFVGGRNVAEVEKRHGLIGTTGTLLLLAGVALGAYAAIKLLDDDTEAELFD
jgi:hypothetical protein